MLRTLGRMMLAAVAIAPLTACGKSEPDAPASVLPEKPDVVEEDRLAKEARAAKEAAYRKALDDGTKALAAGDTDAAVAHLKRAAEENPTAGEPHYQIARAHLAKKNDEAALKELTEAVRLDPRHAGAYMERAALYERAGQIDDAGYDYYRVIDLEPDRKTTARAFWLRSSINDRLGKRDLYRHDRDRAMELDPEYRKRVTAGDVRVYNHTETKLKLEFEQFVNPDGSPRTFRPGSYYTIPDDNTRFLLDGDRCMPARSVRFKITTNFGSKTYEASYTKGTTLDIHIYDSDLPSR
ncbi:tetratricopeptide repeat protein [Frigoriglobus tundricola]|uniref:Uncharacterized protein n=1 Tax=Frigoriglobus tundricola TaxID=2774151 RepID=A0A6M5YQD0_9BACT|nr:tetratricopeptide repeat protein [Frigoriglobus tundricola]QJW95714.1 hypothetical protein FTUN_3268 [Frigoriglobus tundricola]